MIPLSSPLLLLCFVSPGRAAPDQGAGQMEAAITDIMDRMTRMEEEMVSKDKRIAELETSQKEMMAAMAETSISTSVSLSSLEEEVRGVRSRHSESPYSYTCGWREEWTNVALDNTNITYERLLYSSTSGMDGGLDITTGVYTAWISGTWSITYSSTSVQYSGDIIQAFLFVNGQMLVESQYWASYFESDGRVSSLGARTLHLHLNAGDTVTLGTGDQGHYGEFSGLWYITFCVELKQTDIA